jgi:hypothetical protein
VVASPSGVAAGVLGIPCRLVVLSCPPPLCPHLEFALSAELEQPVSLRWAAQIADPGALTATMDIPGPGGLAGRVASRLRRLGPVRFEVTEAVVDGADAERYAYTPDLGLFRTSLSACGEAVVGEGQLRALLTSSHHLPAAANLAHGLERLLGTAWDEELEPLRRGGAEAPVSWLRSAG